MTRFHLDWSMPTIEGVGYIEPPKVFFTAKTVTDEIDHELDCRMVRQQLAARDGLLAAGVLYRLAEGPATTGQLLDLVGMRRQKETFRNLLHRLLCLDIIGRETISEKGGRYDLWRIENQRFGALPKSYKLRSARYYGN